MKIKALFFAACRDIVGNRELDVDVGEGSQVEDDGLYRLEADHRIAREQQQVSGLDVAVEEDAAGARVRRSD